MWKVRSTRSSQSVKIPAAIKASHTMTAVALAVLSEVLLAEVLVAGTVGLALDDVESLYPGYWYR